MTDNQFTRLLGRLAKVGNQYLELQKQAEDEYERRYGVHPSDIDDDMWIDGCTVTSGELSEGVTAEDMKIKATFVEGDKKFHIRTGNGTACGVFLSINIASDKTELPRKSVCKNCLRAGKGAYEEVEEPEHLTAMPEGHRIMEVGETITAKCMYWYDDRWTEASSTVDYKVAGGVYCCPVVSQKQPETSDNSDRGEQVSEKPVQDQIKKKMHEYECRAKNAEDEVVELKRYKKAAEHHGLSVMVESNGVHSFHDMTPLYQGLQKDIYRSIGEAVDMESERDKLQAKVTELQEKLKLLDALEDLFGEYSIDNIRTIMEAMPSPEEMEGYEVRVSTERPHKAHGNSKVEIVEGDRWDITIIRKPIIEYIPTEDITDELCEEHGRIPCEVCNNCSTNKAWIPSILIQVEIGVEYAYETPKEGRHGMRWWNQCRIRKDTIERLRGNQ